LVYDYVRRKLHLSFVHSLMLHCAEEAYLMQQETLARPYTEEGFLDYLNQNNLMDSIACKRVATAMQGSGQPVDTILLELGLLEEHKLADALASYMELERITAVELNQLPALEISVPQSFLRRSFILPIAEENGFITIATARPLDAAPPKALAYFLGRKLIIKVAVVSELKKQLADLYTEDSQTAVDAESPDIASGDVERLRDIASEVPIIRLLNRLITAAVDRDASDVHIELLEDHIRVRYRIDGALQVVEALDRSLQLGLVSRIKILARLNIAEQRLPQDGRIRIAVKGRDIDLRVATTPTLYGENVVLRILDRKGMALDLAALGFDDKAVAQLGRILTAPNGVILVTGPTGSGKTTTLYAALTLLNLAHSKIFTVEDPIEYNIRGINQILVRPQIGLDFASILRSVLRQDPDIIMVGEIRDSETAKIAVQASLTGHLVLSTLHTNSAAASITRLRNMGTEDFLIASSVRAIVAQRLVRKKCVNHDIENACPRCNGTGYAGRTVIYEILEFTDEIKQAVLKGVSDAEIEASASKQGMLTLSQHGQKKIQSSETTQEEITRIMGLALQ
jgi:general secretion pathway protein E